MFKYKDGLFSAVKAVMMIQSGNMLQNIWEYWRNFSIEDELSESILTAWKLCTWRPRGLFPTKDTLSIPTRDTLCPLIGAVAVKIVKESHAVTKIKNARAKIKTFILALEKGNASL